MINYVEAWEGGLIFYSATKHASWPAYVVAQGVEILNRETYTSHMCCHENIAEDSKEEKMLFEIIQLAKSEAEIE